MTKPKFRDDIENRSKLRYALLIDSENNSQLEKLSDVIQEISTMGITLPIRRIYADFSSPQDVHTAPDWKTYCRKYATTPIQVFSHRKESSSLDSAIIMDAMDLLHEDNSKLDGFVIVTSDSRYSRLAQRIRMAGKHVIGVGDSEMIEELDTGSFDHFIFSNQVKLLLEEPSVPVETAETTETTTSTEATDVVIPTPVSTLENNDSGVKTWTVNEMKENIVVTVNRSWKQSIWELWSGTQKDSSSPNIIIETSNISTNSSSLPPGENVETKVQPDSKQESLVEQKLPPTTLSSLEKNLNTERNEKDKNTTQGNEKSRMLTNEELLDELHSILYDLAKDEKTGWVDLLDFIKIWNREQPDFQLRRYGFTSFRRMFQSYPESFELRSKSSRSMNASSTDIRSLRYFPKTRQF
jgi:uncharacterized LabA/DUF88 family protein